MYEYKIIHNSIKHTVITQQPIMMSYREKYRNIGGDGFSFGREISEYYLCFNDPILVEPLGTFIIIDYQKKLKIVARKTEKINGKILRVKEFDVHLKGAQ